MTEATPLASEQITPETFLAQLRRVNTDRYAAWATEPCMRCDHCGYDQDEAKAAGSTRCNPPFAGQDHAFNTPHPYLTRSNDAGILFDAAELGGEVGELLNVVKKLEREARGWRGSRAAPEDFADECADVLICLDKLARRMDVDLEAATVRKFNATSEKVGLPQRLSASPAPSGQGVSGEVDEPWRVAAWNACRKQGISQEASIGFVKALAEEMALAAPAPSCAPGEVERLACSLRALSNGIAADAEATHLDAEIESAAIQLARMLEQRAALSPQGLDAKEGGHPDDVAVDLFAARMKPKLAAARGKGRGGWDNPERCSTGYLCTLLHEHVAKGDPVDVANFCMMLAHYGASTATPSQRLDAATVERRRKALREALEHVDSIAGEMNGVVERAHLIDADDAAMNLADAFGVEFAPGWEDKVSSLATDPHQHGGKEA